MSNQGEVLLLLDAKLSKRLKWMLAFLHLLAFVASIATSLIIPIKFGLCFGICVHYWLVIKQSTKQPYQIRYSDKLGWQLLSSNGFESVEILKTTFITIFVIILHIKSQFTDKLTILVVSDALSNDDYRRLIVQLITTGIKTKRSYDGSGKP